MSKLTIAPLAAGFRSSNRLNENFEAIETALENTLSRDGTAPNQMEADLDLNSNRIINLDAPVDDNDAVRLVDVQDAIDLAVDLGDITGYVDDAEAAADDAAAAAATAVAATASKLNITGTNIGASGATLRTNIGTDLATNVNVTPAGTDAVVRTVQDKLRDKINYKDYKLVIDADDTNAMQKAIARAASLGGAVIDLDGSTIACGSLTLPNLSRHIEIRNGRVNVVGDVTWLSGVPGATSITYVTVSNIFFDASSHTTVGRALIDASLMTYSTFDRLWIYNIVGGRTIGLYVGGNGIVGPYYNVFNLILGGGLLYGIQFAPAADVEYTVNNNTIMNCRFTPGAAGRYGVYIGSRNQQNRILTSVFEDTTGGSGIYDDGICTNIVGSRFENMDVGIELGTLAAGGNDIGCYFDSCTLNRYFSNTAAGLLHNSFAASDGSGLAEDNVFAGGGKFGGGVRFRGDPGFPGDLAAGQGHAYGSGTLGGVYGGWGSTNDLTFINRLGQIAASIPHDTTNWSVAGSTISSDYYVGANKVVGARVTGFGAMTGTATKTAIATYTAPDIEATYTEATIQALADAVQALSRRVKAQDDALIAHGLIGA